MPKKQYSYRNLSLKDIKGEQWEDIPGYGCHNTNTGDKPAFNCTIEELK